MWQKRKDNSAMNCVTNSWMQTLPPTSLLKLHHLLTKWLLEVHLTTTPDFLTSLCPTPARFYLLPKIHKPNNPGRPIISSCDAPTENISLFVEHHLRPRVQLLPSCLRDTTHFLSRLEGLDLLPPQNLLVTKSLYKTPPTEMELRHAEESS